jgi:hypothetical protein
MTDVTDWDLYEKMIQDMMRDAINELGERVEEVVKQYIQQDVYDFGDSYRTFYEPTGEFKESIKSVPLVSKPDSPEVLIGSHGGSMSYQPEKYTHGSIWSKNGTEYEEDVRNYLAEILAFNHSGDLFGNNVWFHGRDSYYYNALEHLKAGGWLNKEFKKILRSKGLVVK